MGLPIYQDRRGAKNRSPKPAWLRVKAPGGIKYNTMKGRARRLGLATVCEEARCPNIGECWSGRESTATFMLMGDVCTRGCRFCAVTTSKHPPPLDEEEPEAIALAIAELELGYVVLTSVDRDDLPDGGSNHLRRCLDRIHSHRPSVLLEMLAPDFLGDEEAIRRVATGPLAVFAHNVETVERLTHVVRDPRSGYQRSLDVLAESKRIRPELLTKSSIMLGVGEKRAEVLTTMRQLRDQGVDILTLGQYLRPSPKHLPVEQYLAPAQFEELADRARDMGFEYVASGPLVRSSYRAGELFVEKRLGQRNSPQEKQQ